MVCSSCSTRRSTFAFRQLRQLPLRTLLGVFLFFAFAVRNEFLVDSFHIHNRMAGKLHDGPAGTEHISGRACPSASDVNAGDVQYGGHHLRSNEAVPNQLVQIVLILFQIGRMDSGSRAAEVGPDGFMSFLCGL